MFVVVCSQRAQAAPLVLTDAADGALLSQHAQWSQSAQSHEDFRTVLELTDWAPVRPDVEERRESNTQWLKISVEQSETQTLWYLSAGTFRTNSLEVYFPGKDGRWLIQRAGRFVAHSQWPIPGRTPSFLIDLPPGEHTLYVRVSGNVPSFLESARFYQHSTEMAQRTQAALLYGGVMGMCLLILVSQVLQRFLLWYDTPAYHLLYTLSLLFNIVVTLGYWHQVVDVSIPWLLRLTGILLCLGYFVMARFSAHWLRLQEFSPTINRWHLVFATLVTLTACATVALGQFDAGFVITRLLFLTGLPVFLLLGCYLVWKGWRGALSYVLIFGLIDLIGMARMLRNMGIIPDAYAPDMALTLVLALHLLLVAVLFSYQQVGLQRAITLEKKYRKEQADFVDMVSHEFRTPLAVINTSAQMVAADLTGPRDKLLERVDNIRRATIRLTTLLDDYLSVGRMNTAQEPIQLQRCDFYEVVEEAASDWPLERVRIAYADSCPTSWVCDPSLMVIVLRNLLSNADKHSPSDAVISLRVASHTEGTLTIDVCDLGEGIAADELPQVFTKYFRGRTAQRLPGAGLGLYLVKTIVQAHGGTISVASLPSEGTTFTVVLPLLRIP